MVFADTEDTWHVLFNKMGKTYREPTVVLFSGAVESACGYAQAAMGPFCCPADQKVYIGDDRLQQRAGDMLHRIHFPTAARGSAFTGLNRALRQAISPNVIPSRQILFKLRMDPF